jgi:hypothetical protein
VTDRAPALLAGDLASTQAERSTHMERSTVAAAVLLALAAAPACGGGDAAEARGVVR